MRINILGTEYELNLVKSTDFDFEERSGLIKTQRKKIFVRTDYDEDDGDSYVREVILHELIHGFLFESGLWANSNDIEGWAINEEMVDWFAHQMPKIMKLYSEILEELQIR